MKILLFLLILSGPCCQVCAAYPIEPRPLRKLIIESEYIIIGYVEKVEEISYTKAKGRRQWTDRSSVATIRIREILQGQTRDSIIKIQFEPYLIRPAPDRYVPNTEDIAFIDKAEDG